MSALTAAELTSLRADLAAMALPDTCTVQRDQGGAADPYGGAPAPTWADLATGVRCAYWQGGGRTRRDQDEVVLEQHRLAVAVGTDVTERDRITNVRDAAGSLRTAGPLRVNTVASRETHLELDVTEVSW